MTTYDTLPSQAPSLTIYKASAGSGKTFTIAVRYIELLIRRPDSYRNILAVTFTNKATEEMKMRILKELYGIGHRLPSSNDYMKRICHDLHLEEDFVAERAKTALSMLLHDYSMFNVQTIDSFFQHVLRNLGRELGLNVSPHLELRQEEIKDEAVEAFFRSLTEDDKRLQWVMHFIQDRIDEEKNWNVMKAVKTFALQLFRDEFKLNRDLLYHAISSERFFHDYTSTLIAMKKKAVADIKGHGERFMKEIAEHGLTIDDFKRKSGGVAGFFRQLTDESSYEDIMTKKKAKAVEDVSEWVAKANTTTGPLIRQLAQERWMHMLKQAIDCFDKCIRVINSVNLTLRHINELRLLQSIDEQIRTLNLNANRFLLSDTQTLLHNIIYDKDGVTDAPFIYEKIGTRIAHIMIDEFQDTGREQWMNFRTLLSECMSHNGSENMIVGDVKQCIYRWRAGDWRLFSNIERHFPGHREQIHNIPLDINWRSSRCIVQFNNSFFQHAKKTEQERIVLKCETNSNQLITAYNEVEQHIATVHNEDSGYVSIDIFNNLNVSEDASADIGPIKSEDRMLHLLTTRISALLQSGVLPKDIAIICRTNLSLNKVAARLDAEMPDVPIVTRKAFRLHNSLAVRLLIESLRLLTDPDDVITQASLIAAYQGAVLRQPYLDSLTNNNNTYNAQLLPDNFINQRDKLLGMPLINLAEELCNIFHLYELPHQSNYLSTFFDEIERFVEDSPADISTFLQAWDNHICNTEMPTSEQNGLQLATIHASKGLEFDYVFMPYCDWGTGVKTDSVLWCQAKEEPYSQLPLIPLSPSEQVLKSIYADDYRDEVSQNQVDHLNLLYVGFTRAAKALCIMAENKRGSYRQQLMIDILPKVTDDLKGSVLEDNFDKQEALLHFQYGTMPLPSPSATKAAQPSQAHNSDTSVNPFKTTPAIIDIKLSSHPLSVEFRQSNQSRVFVHNDHEDNTRQHYIQRGNILHYIFSRIRTLDDIDTILCQLSSEGLLLREGLKEDEVRKMILSATVNPLIASWFAPDAEVKTEQTIAVKDKDNGIISHYRPDRVIKKEDEVHVVDFKFGREKEEYHAQVAEYMALLRRMGYTRVRGFLWYVYINRVIEV